MCARAYNHNSTIHIVSVAVIDRINFVFKCFSVRKCLDILRIPTFVLLCVLFKCIHVLYLFVCLFVCFTG